MKAADIGTSFFLMALGGFVAWQSKNLSLGILRAPGPGVFPFCLGLLLIGLALIILIQGVRAKPGVPETGLNKSRVILALGTLFAYLFVFESLGYLVSTFLFIFILQKIMVKKKWWFGPTAACLISVATYILFRVWLKVLLPRGFFGF